MVSSNFCLYQFTLIVFLKMTSSVLKYLRRLSGDNKPLYDQVMTNSARTLESLG
jgi:hypothetical protein